MKRPADESLGAVSVGLIVRFGYGLPGGVTGGDIGGVAGVSGGPTGVSGGGAGSSGSDGGGT